MSTVPESAPDPNAHPESGPELDCRGRPCPAPIIELARHVGDVGVGEVLAVVADDVAARYDVPAWCRMKGHEYLGADDAPDGVARYRVRRLV